MMAAGIIITCIIISLGFYIAREASDTASSGTGQINELQAEFADTSKMMYENTEVSGHPQVRRRDAGRQGADKEEHELLYLSV